MALRIRTKHPYNVVEGDIFLDIPAAEALLNKQAQQLEAIRSIDRGLPNDQVEAALRFHERVRAAIASQPP